MLTFPLASVGCAVLLAMSSTPRPPVVLALPAQGERSPALMIPELEEKLVDNRQRADCFACRAPRVAPTSFVLNVGPDVPFAQLWRVMAVGGRAGYSRVLLVGADARAQ